MTDKLEVNESCEKAHNEISINVIRAMGTVLGEYLRSKDFKDIVRGVVIEINKDRGKGGITLYG